MKYLLLLGPPKCGTSSLFGWLAQHPRVAPADPKETYFLVDSGNPYHGMRGASLTSDGAAGFDRFFAAGTDAVRLEATTHHFYQKSAIDFASAHDCHAHMALRRPSARLLSHFRYARDVRNEISPALSFDSYVDHLLSGNVERLRSQFLDERTFMVFDRQLELSDYARWIDKWLGKLGESRFSIGVMEAYVGDARSEVERILKLAGLGDEDGLELSLDRQNTTYRVASHRMHRLARNLAQRFPAGRLRDAVKGGYMTLQQRFARRDRGYEAGLQRARSELDPLALKLRDIPMAAHAPEAWGLCPPQTDERS